MLQEGAGPEPSVKDKEAAAAIAASAAAASARQQRKAIPVQVWLRACPSVWPGRVGQRRGAK